MVDKRKIPDIIQSEGKTYLIYNFTFMETALDCLRNTIKIFLGSDRVFDNPDLPLILLKDKPIVVIDCSFEGESASFLRPSNQYHPEHEGPKFLNHNNSGLGDIHEDKTFMQLLHSLDAGLCQYDLDKTILLYGDANIEQNYTNWCKKNKQTRVFGKCIYNPHRLLQRSLNVYSGIYGGSVYDYIPNMLFKPKHFICMNGVSKPHRFEMVNFLFKNNWQGKGHISWLNRRNSDNYRRYSTLTPTSVFRCQTLQLDFDSEELDQGTNQLKISSQYREACFDIVNESTANDEDIFITDKTWKAILQKTPFIIFGSKNSHKHLEEYFGIKPYTELFDYKFDGLNFEERFHSLKHDNLVRLINMDIHKLNEIVNSDKMQELLEYNKTQLLSKGIDDTRWDKWLPVLRKL